MPHTPPLTRFPPRPATPPPGERRTLSRARRSEGGGRRPKVDACVIFCGLNDFKKLPRGRTAAVFGKDLRLFLNALHRKLGRECLIFLPAMPMEPTR